MAGQRQVSRQTTAQLPPQAPCASALERKSAPPADLHQDRTLLIELGARVHGFPRFWSATSLLQSASDSHCLWLNCPFLDHAAIFATSLDVSSIIPRSPTPHVHLIAALASASPPARQSVGSAADAHDGGVTALPACLNGNNKAWKSFTSGIPPSPVHRNLPPGCRASYLGAAAAQQFPRPADLLVPVVRPMQPVR